MEIYEDIFTKSLKNFRIKYPTSWNNFKSYVFVRLCVYTHNIDYTCKILFINGNKKYRVIRNKIYSKTFSRQEPCTLTKELCNYPVTLDIKLFVIICLTVSVYTHIKLKLDVSFPSINFKLSDIIK